MSDFSNYQVGDEIAIYSTQSSFRHIAKVEGKTSHTLTVEGDKFYFGGKPCATSNPCVLEEVTRQLRDYEETMDIVTHFQRLNLYTLPLETLRKLRAAL